MTPAEAVIRCDQVMAHAWMVRTFIKHSPEIEDFPELMGIVRAVFDTARALETRVTDPAGYFHMLRKKIGKLRAAAAEFQIEAPRASTHTNFQQAVISMNACIQEFEQILGSNSPQTQAPGAGPRNPDDEPTGLTDLQQEASEA